PHAFQHHGTPLIPILTIRQIIGEDADVRGAEDFTQLERALEPLQVWLEGLIDFDLANGRADGAETKTVLVQERLQLLHLKIREVEDVGLVDRPQFDVAYVARLQHINLLLRVGTDLIGEGAEGKHATRSWLLRVPGQS